MAYLPDGKVIGLSKIPRIVDLFARRLQVQERMTADIANAIEQNLKPRAVAVRIIAEHTCMRLRGVRSTGSMVTSDVRGLFREDAKAREEVHRMFE